MSGCPMDAVTMVSCHRNTCDWTGPAENAVRNGGRDFCPDCAGGLSENV